MQTSIHSRVSSRSHSGNLYLRGDIEFERESPISSGGYGELFAGWNEAAGMVALKRLRIRTEEDRQRKYEETMNEALVWRALIHTNVLPFLGVLFESREVYLVSPLVENGSLPSFIRTHPDANRATLLKEVAEGLAYLHSQGVVHGDVKGSNVVVDMGPRAAICDFGLSKLLTPSPSSSTGGVGTIRWQSPEIMEGGARSYEGDVYAYGMTVYEIITGKIPFYGIIKDSAVIVAVVMHDQRPSMEGITDDSLETLRRAAQRCWAKIPESRPWMTEVLHLLFSAPSPDLGNSLQALSVTPGVAHIRDGHYGLEDNGRGPDSDRRTDIMSMDPVNTVPSPPNQTMLPGKTARIVDTQGEEVGEIRAPEVSIPPRPPSTIFASETNAVTSLALTSSTSPTLKMSWKKRAAIVRAETQRVLQGPMRALAVSVSMRPSYPRDASWVEMQTLKGHTDQVTVVSFSLDGSRLASGSQDSTVHLWDAASGAEIATLRGHSLQVWSIAFSPDGLRLASGSEDRMVRVWNTEVGTELVTLKGHTDMVKTVSFSPDGSRLMSGSDDQTVGVWDVSSGANLAILRGHRNWVTTVEFASGGWRMLSGSYDRTLRLWNDLGEEVATLRGHTDWVTTIAFAPDGWRLASGSDDGRVRVWESASGQKVAKMRGRTGAVRSIAFSPDGLHLAAGSEGGTVQVWDASSGTRIAKLRGHSRWVNSIVFSPNGSQLASGSGDGTVRLWRTGRIASAPISPNTPR